MTVHIDILCNENQTDALFILNLFCPSTSTCFGHVYCPSSCGIYCICTVVGKGYKFNPLAPSDPYMGLTAQLTSRRCILSTYSTNIRTEYFKRAA
jgi:hypothetical protein